MERDVVRPVRVDTWKRSDEVPHPTSIRTLAPYALDIKLDTEQVQHGARSTALWHLLLANKH